ncbi:MAG: amino acid permease [Bryobacteraceae bacterium]|jgi:amino acid transporter
MAKFETEVRLSREMTLMDVTLIGVGAMIGAGIFVLTGIAAGVAGPALIVTFILNGAVALLTAMSYAELGSCYHDAGGGYLWVKEGLPKWNGFLAGWMSWFAHAVACSLYALGFGAYFESLLADLGVTVPHWGFLAPQKLLAAGVAVLFAYINFRGASETGKIGNIVTMAKIVILLIFIGLGLHYLIGRPDWRQPFTPFMPNGWPGVIRAMGLTFIAFQGFEVIAQCSEEVRAPRRNIPRATFLSLLIVVPIYVLVAIAALGSVNPGNLTPWGYLALKKETALVQVARQFFVGGGIMLLAGGLVSTMSALNATVYSSSRVAFALGRDRNFPGLFSRVHQVKHTPHWAILISMIIVVLMAVSLPIEDVAASADIMFLLLFLQVNLATISLRKKRPDLDRGFIIPLFPWLSILGIALLLFLAIYMFTYSPKAWLATGVWVILGLTVYKRYASKREIEHARKVRSLKRIEEREYRILVCVGNPRHIDDLSQLAEALALKNRAEILFLHVIDVDEGAPLVAGLDQTGPIRLILQKAEAAIAGRGVSARSVITVSHGVSRGIVDTAEAENCNLIVLGRKREPGFFDRYGTAITDSVLERTPAEVIFLHGQIPAAGVKTIILPFGENIHTRLALELAPALADYFRCRLLIALVVPPGLDPAEREARCRKAEEFVGARIPSAEFYVTEDEDIVHGIVEASESADLLLMGGRTGSFWEMLAASSMTEDITRQARCPVVWAEEYEESKSFLARLLSRSEEERSVDSYAG